MFGKKQVCRNCKEKVSEKFSFCPYCGDSIEDQEKETKEYGLLGKNNEKEIFSQQAPMGFTDKIMGSLMNNLMRTLDKQFKNFEKDFGKIEKAEVMSFPNGIRIKIGNPIPVKRKKEKSIFEKAISEQQLQRMSILPRTEAQTKVKRLNDKVVYELNAPGVLSTDDIFISKLESGYEIKAISNKKVYVNSIPVNLPLRSLSISEDKLLVEFGALSVA